MIVHLSPAVADAVIGILVIAAVLAMVVLIALLTGGIRIVVDQQVVDPLETLVEQDSSSAMGDTRV